MGDSHSSPVTAPKDSWRLTDFAAKGLAARIRNSAVSSAVGGSLSRRNRGAAVSRLSMTQARTTEGDAPVSSA